MQKLAQKVQLEIKEEELSVYLETFQKLEKTLSNFKKLRLGEKTKNMKNINFGYLTLNDLKKLERKFSQERVSKKIQKKNSLVADDGFILFKK